MFSIMSLYINNTFRSSNTHQIYSYEVLLMTTSKLDIFPFVPLLVFIQKKKKTNHTFSYVDVTMAKFLPIDQIHFSKSNHNKPMSERTAVNILFHSIKWKWNSFLILYREMMCLRICWWMQFLQLCTIFNSITHTHTLKAWLTVNTRFIYCCELLLLFFLWRGWTQHTAWHYINRQQSRLYRFVHIIHAHRIYI